MANNIEINPVSDTPFDAATWDGVTTVAPSKNAVLDQLLGFTGLRDDFTSKPNGLLVAADTGQPYYLLPASGAGAMQVVSGKATRVTTSGAAAYAQVDMHAPVTHFGARVVFSPYSTTGGTFAFPIFKSFFTGAAVPDSDLHLIVGPTAWSLGVFAGAVFTGVAAATLPVPLAADDATAYDIDIVLNQHTMTLVITAAVGEVYRTQVIHDSIAASGHIAVFEVSAAQATDTQSKALAWWADCTPQAASLSLASYSRTYSTALGANAGGSDVSDTPTYLTAVGANALDSNTTGVFNSAVGGSALSSNTTGGNNSAVGGSSLYSNTTGAYNSAVGGSALRSNTTGNYNSAVGANVLYSNTTGAYNSAIGMNALYSPAGVTANATTTGLRQTAVGVETGQGSTTQRNDIVCIGYRALVDGNNAIAIGSGASAGAAGAVAIGKDNAGTSATTTVANEIKLGTALHTTNALGDMKVGKGFAAWGVTPPGAQPAAIATPTAPSAGYVQAEAASAKTAIDAIRAALTGAGITL